MEDSPIGSLQSPTCIETYTMRHVDLLNPDPSQICIEDIAHHLALINRFSGATVCPLSVAQHSIEVCYHTPAQWKRRALLHDAAEAYLVDDPRPKKRAMELIGVRASWKVGVEDRLERCIFEALGLPPDMTLEEHAAVKWADDYVCRAEADSFMRSRGRAWNWGNVPKPDFELNSMTWQAARDKFLYIWEHLPSIENPPVAPSLPGGGEMTSQLSR